MMKFNWSFGLILLFFFHYNQAQSQSVNSSGDYSLMFYNTENYFDCENDSLTDDDEFTPTGSRGWNWSRFRGKADRLAKVILAAGKWNPPFAVGLCEIENLNALQYLTNKTALSKFNYKIVHKDSPDQRGIDVAFLYRADLFKPFNYEAIAVTDPLDLSFRTRDILLISGVLNDCDTLHVFVNHWPSRYGGIMETNKYRALAATILKKSITEIRSKYRNAKVICMGDFNDNPKDESLSRVLDAKTADNPNLSGELINLSFPWMTGKIQTIKNQYSWDVFDQIIVSDELLTSTSCVQILNAEIYHPDFLLEPDTKFGGVKLRRTYVGYKYQEGFSDHLPVLLRFQYKVP